MLHQCISWITKMSRILIRLIGFDSKKSISCKSLSAIFFLLAFSPPIRHSHFNSEKQFNSWIVWNVEQKRFVRRMSFITIIIVIVTGKKSRYGCWYAKCVSYSVVSATNTRRNLKYSRVRVFILLPAESKKTETKTNDNVGASCWVVAWFILM